MRIRTVLALLKKEFLNIIRDRKSFIIMILLPLLMFPLMVGLISIILSSYTKIDDKIIFGVNYQISDDFYNFVQNYSDNYKIEIIHDSEDNLKEMFENEEIKTYVINKGNTYELHYDENNTGSFANNQIVENIYKDYKEKYLSDVLATEGINYNELKNDFNIEFIQENVTDMGSIVPSIISMVLVMIISSVCFSVSIDVTTSEKEKGTLETLLSLPINRVELITSKFITVFILSAMSGFLTYISLFVTLHFASNILSSLGVLSFTINFSVLFIYLIAIILVSLLFSGLLLSVTIFSKNLKEAQNSLYPLEIFVTIISMLPLFGINASLKYALIPFVNISLLFNNILASNVDPLFVVLTLISTLVYAIILIMIISRLYNEEDVLFNSKALSYLKFKDGKSRSTGFSIVTSLLIALIIFLLSIYFTLMFATASKYLLLSMVPITTFVVILIAALIVKLDYKDSFKLNKFSFTRFIKLFPLYIGTYILANEIVNSIGKVFPSIIKDYSIISDVLSFNNIYLAILIVSILPAIFEELLFRGVLYNSFNKRYGVLIAIIVSALIFGIYHMNVLQGIYAFLFGLFLGYSYYKSGSLFVPIIFHFINNFISTLVSFYPSLNIAINGYIYIIILLIGTFFLISGIFINNRKE